MSIEDSFRKSLEQGFVNKAVQGETSLTPELLVNDKAIGKKFLSKLLDELNTCDVFWISVAFITTGGVATIINTLIELEKRGIEGKILASQYLNFTHPEALKRLSQFSNIELRVAVGDSFHSKGYLFKKGEFGNIIIGSSNLTQTALCSNKEWNLKISSHENAQLYDDIYREFEKEFNLALPVTTEYLNSYNELWKNAKTARVELSKSFVNSGEKIIPNEMQKEALRNLSSIRNKGETKSLLISATGTGKTFLSAFDVQQVKPKKFLFVVHRRTIAEKAMETFKYLLGNNVSMGLFSGQYKELDCDYLFSTIQTVSKQENLDLFSKDYFDYIVIDETHRAGADSYLKLLDYFKPEFLLGMTATPERTDGADIFKLFDYNIAYEIRLHQALSEDMLIPFHYYGVTDLTIDNEVVDDHTDFNKLTSKARVDHILEKSKLYGTDSGEIRGLVFCSKNEISSQICNEFNKRGYKSVMLSGGSSEDERLHAIRRLESKAADKIDYIFTVDIFNEGIDIPSVNQIIMLRPTQSAIIFVQQLGRGLRKASNKDYLTVIDFIGNYDNNYLVPIALYGDTSYNKDTIRKMLASGSSLIPGASTVNFDEISKERIFNAINKVNMQKLTDLKKDYHNLKYKIGRIPTMMDFMNHGSRDPWLYASYKKSYLNFINLVEDKCHTTISKDLMGLLALEKKYLIQPQHTSNNHKVSILEKRFRFFIPQITS